MICIIKVNIKVNSRSQLITYLLFFKGPYHAAYRQYDIKKALMKGLDRYWITVLDISLLSFASHY